jgi:ectoine hydroxylase
MIINDIYPSRTVAKAQVIARQDPVVYGSWDSSSPLSQSQVEQFDRDGFLLLEHVFTPQEVALLQKESTRILNNADQLKQETVVFEPASKEVRSVFEIHKQCKLMERLSSDVRLAGVASFLLDDEVYIHQSRLNYKPGFVGKDFYWHSDFETWHTEDGLPRMRTLSMSVLLTENTPNNGPLMLLPGSHRQFISCIGKTPKNHYSASLRKQEFGLPDDENLEKMVDACGIASSTGQPGSVVVFDSNTMHGSNSNITPLPRSNTFFVFNAISNQLKAPFAAEKPRPEFVASREIQAIKPITGSLV